MKDTDKLIGRQWIIDQKDSNTFANLIQIPAIQDQLCQRCGSKVEAKLPNGELYCRECIGLGRVSSNCLLVRNPAQEQFKPITAGGMTWTGKLTKKQKRVSDQLIENFEAGKNTLVHAVTGAGKTEMLFELIASCLSKGQRACIATPRIDVVNELYPRFAEAFSLIEIGKYHGKEYQEANNDRLTICTTHQLMKFYQAFDLLVIDEVDSFPYVNNPQLHFAAKVAVKDTGRRVYLTATPTEDLLAEVEVGSLDLIKLNRRFHGGLLPLPKERLFLKPFMDKEKLNLALKKQIEDLLESQHPLLVFVPRIDQIQAYVEEIRQIVPFAPEMVEGVHASDPLRLDKVEAFRQKKLKVLVTTTILERGVTFKNVWVIIIASDDPIYSMASLVQIAGRVGRDKDDPDGTVLYCYRKYTKNIRMAIKQIKEMNI